MRYAQPVNFLSADGRFLSETPQTIAGGMHSLPVMVGRVAPNSGDLVSPSTHIDAPQDMPVATVNPSGSVQVRDENHYANVISLSLAMATVGSVKFLDSPQGKRNFLAIRNTSSTANLYLDFNRDATANSTIKITPGATILFDAVVPQDDLYMYNDAVNGAFSYSYSNISN